MQRLKQKTITKEKENEHENYKNGIMINTYTDDIHDIALTTFEVTCFMFPLDEWEIDDDIESPCDKTRAIVEFDGAIEGGMVINPSETLLTAIAANMLGTDDPTVEEKEGALCEIANIVCGNAAPLFAKNDKICVIRPPKIIRNDVDTDELHAGMHKEKVNVFLDEGAAEITVYLGD